MRTKSSDLMTRNGFACASTRTITATSVKYKTPYEPVTNIHAECFRCLGVSLHGLCYDSPYGPMPEWNVVGHQYGTFV